MSPKTKLTLIRWILRTRVLAGIDFRKPAQVIQAVSRSWIRPFDRLPLFGVGAEIGVYTGLHARDLLNLHPKITKLFLVDPYEAYSGEPNPLSELVLAKRAAHRNLIRFNEKTQWVRGTAYHIPGSEALNFAYIDGNHSAESVRLDIHSVWPRIAYGGIMGGHDFNSDFTGVVQSVIRFASERNLTLHVESPDWWIMKS